jgi:hypothetical protein
VQKVNGLAVFVHCTIQIPPHAFYFDIGFIHTPTHPYRALAPVERLFELGAIFDDSPVNGGVIHLHPTFLHAFFDMACAQGIRHIPADSHQNNLAGEMRSFEGYPRKAGQLGVGQVR